MAIKAILSGGWFGKGPGKSKYKHILPQANSDFIYAIIIEEYGVIGGVIILSTYMIILFRIIVIATNAPSYFTSLMVISLGLPIIIQALIHISVNISLIPVTGQNLPLISTGGTSICINFLRLGMIYNISKKKIHHD
jgi:cell division protein FtsW